MKWPIRDFVAGRREQNDPRFGGPDAQLDPTLAFHLLAHRLICHHLEIARAGPELQRGRLIADRYAHEFH